MNSGLDESRYAPLLSKEGEYDPDNEGFRVPTQTTQKSCFARYACYIALIASLIANVALVVTLHNVKVDQQKIEPACAQISQPACPACPQISQPACPACPTCPSAAQPTVQSSLREKSPYAGLDYSSNGTWQLETPYAQENITAADEAWMAINVDNAFVSFNKSYAKELGLPVSLRFPWDPNNRELYLISSIHSIHCLTVFHRSNYEYRNNRTQTYSTDHVLHCLDNVRIDIQCSADDTPRFVPRNSGKSTVKTGVGQIRQCRSWEKLNSWANENPGCFAYNELLHKELEEKPVYPAAWQYCKKDDPYLPVLQHALQKGKDWVPDPPPWPDKDEVEREQQKKKQGTA